ncbi:Hypothetical predicted protein [Paramuricea clavata]|uniref:Uncharacterized protein n=1 Tax=Paramuricea clavata TaxID=317549 RepID=A0A6S7GEN6_PARCT|nr:Hypothetical predicted protein [Paramuricea clavata]
MTLEKPLCPEDGVKEDLPMSPEEPWCPQDECSLITIEQQDINKIDATLVNIKKWVKIINKDKRCRAHKLRLRDKQLLIAPEAHQRVLDFNKSLQVRNDFLQLSADSIVTDNIFIEFRDYLILSLQLRKVQRPDAIANLTVEQKFVITVKGFSNDVHFTATIIRKTVVTTQRELSRKCNANIESGHLANAMTHLPSTSETYALQDRTEDAINTYKFIKNQVHTNIEPESDEPVEHPHTPDKSTSTTNVNQSNLSSPSCSIPPSFQPPSKSFAKTCS